MVPSGSVGIHGSKHRRTFGGGRLYRHGVRDIFTLCGGHIAPIYDGCLRYGIRPIDTRHEQASLRMQATGMHVDDPRRWRCAGDGRTGRDRRCDGGLPMRIRRRLLSLCWAAAEVRSVGRGALQEMEQVPLMRTITKWCATANDPKRLREVHSDGNPDRNRRRSGAGVLELPFDVLMAQVDDNELIVLPLLPPWPRTQADPAQVDMLAGCFCVLKNR